MMELETLLSKKKATILKQWFNGVIDVYPTDTRRFLLKQKDPFSNPVGRTIEEGIRVLLDHLISGEDPSPECTSFLDDIMRIRAVQDLTPSEAISFIPYLKGVVRVELHKEVFQKSMFDQALALESRIDQLTLLAFDAYTKCRERIYEIKANELRRRTNWLLKNTNVFKELSASAPESEA